LGVVGFFFNGGKTMKALEKKKGVNPLKQGKNGGT